MTPRSHHILLKETKLTHGQRKLHTKCNASISRAMMLYLLLLLCIHLEPVKETAVIIVSICKRYACIRIEK